MFLNHRVCTFYAIAALGVVGVAEVAEVKENLHHQPAGLAIRAHYRPPALPHSEQQEPFNPYSLLVQQAPMAVSGSITTPTLTFDPSQMIRILKG